ncbi:ATP-binding protein [Sphingomonas abietis]|uniref:histidine kinase n=1 Tax=Sphingomonas abietis TaxID=3012344 RepID=A0ABY7NMK3_9SPHN|nr:ATP-binding protein [Sphingomonas abietis]WBO20736.1 ATP-binding protein [Sphingomonas abietis]
MTILPRSLAGRLAFFFVVAVAFAQLVAFLLFTHETSRLDRAAVRTRLGDQVETLIRLVDALTPDDAAKALAIYDTPRHRYAIGRQASVSIAMIEPETVPLGRNISRRTGGAATEVRLALGEADAGTLDTPLSNAAQGEALLMSARLRDGRWINAAFPPRDRAPSWMRMAIYQIVASIVAVLVVAALSRRSIVRPMAALADMARRIGQGATVPVLPETGPEELRVLTTAFNMMQARLHASVVDRTQMLVAIGHDLRTPIASLWLRAEMMEETDLRAAMIATIIQMRDMVEAALNFAKADAGSYVFQALDLVGIVDSVAGDYRALGFGVTLNMPAAVPFVGDSAMLRRAIDNLVGNAIRYGESAEVTVFEDGDRVVIRVEDDGPGIPEARMEDVFKPFNRLEDSRSVDTGGTGLGLAVVRSVVRIHGGSIALKNRQKNGLSAEISVPYSAG